jgi:hypothetical protein
LQTLKIPGQLSFLNASAECDAKKRAERRGK